MNLPLNEARNLGAVLGCEFFILGDAQTLRRSPSTGLVYLESYASIFLVSARTGRLVGWERPTFRGSTPEAAEGALFAELSSGGARNRKLISLRRAQEHERGERELAVDQQTPIIEQAPDTISALRLRLRFPRPFSRLTPLSEQAKLAEAEATVDVLVDLDASGEVTRVKLRDGRVLV